MRDLGRALRLGPRGWLDLGRAALELARARWRLRRHSVRDLIALGQRQATPPRPVPPGRNGLLDRVALAVPRAAARVPWRADCWVQALAAQSWLAREGVPAEIWIGVRQDRGAFEAHAWLRSGERAVTGGDGDGFAPLITPDRPLP